MRKALFAIIICLITQVALAAKLAIIRSDKAVVYSDVELKSPIGTLKKGTRIKIGEKYRRQGMVAYTEFQNRLVYIQVSDLLIQGSKSIKLENTSRFRALTEKEIQKELEKSEQYFSVNAGTSQPGEKWQDLANKMNTSPDQPFYYVEGQIEYYFPKRMFAVMGGMGYLQNDDPNLQLSMTTFHVNFHWIPINIRLAEFHLFTGLIGSPWMLIETENGKYFTKGSAFGGQAGGEVRFFPGKKFTLAAGASMQYLNVYGHEEIQLPGQYRELYALTEYTETKMYVNLAMRF